MNEESGRAEGGGKGQKRKREDDLAPSSAGAGPPLGVHPPAGAGPPRQDLAPPPPGAGPPL
eukprot:CAMPEP_0197487388 /NCGR_PEP_ID=MMETSP1311-20131121/2416_1 /TAXON_ID=464262 /ORGANISM="Genus nov. species nov., Strain RCC856" /LENGTH=60 /DNA_ID=CAMNT_0043031021 /DNA_START=231 /DNA_END=409 /DNA_ORIENTATION=-